MKLIYVLLAVLLASLPARAAVSRSHETDVPFRLLHNQITVSVHVGAREASMFLDTDTSPSAIDGDLAKALRLPVTGKSETSTGEGTLTQRVIPVMIPDLAVGGVRATNVAALTSDFHAVSRLVHTPIVGVLGTSFLRGRIFQIDYPHHMLRFFDSADRLAPRPSTPFQVKDGLIVVNLSIDGHRGVATIDTGSSGGLIFTPHGVQRYLIDASEHAAKASKSAGYNGAVATRKGSVTGAVFNGIALGRVPAEFWSQAGPVPWMDCDIGNSVLKNYLLTIDYVHDRFDIAAPRS